jgi:hypothetical protein
MRAQPETPFIITIDTEGDDLWSSPREITTRNAAYLPRFQALCERYRYKPVYLTNYEMAVCDEYVEFARDALARGACEVGMHLHAWNSPPLEPLTRDDFACLPYLIEYPGRVMREKIRVMTRLIEDRFDSAVVSHRAGRWAFDGRYAQMLLEEGYRVDCSVTPGVDWRANAGAPQGCGGTDYSGFPAHPYFLDPRDISKPAAHGLLEVPMTIRPSPLHRSVPLAYRIPLVRRAANYLSPEQGWLCPVQGCLRGALGRQLDVMLDVARAKRAEGTTHMEFMLHSSELMPGGSPTFRDESDIERLYDALEALFEELSVWCRGMTLKEYHSRLAGSPAARAAQAPVAGIVPRGAAISAVIPIKRSA